jgi:hypothetical protein
MPMITPSRRGLLLMGCAVAYFGETVRRNTRVALYGDADTKRL